jgi:hypothetical protein
MQKFFLYARKSTDVEDKQVLSIEAQLTELRSLPNEKILSFRRSGRKTICENSRSPVV